MIKWAKHYKLECTFLFTLKLVGLGNGKAGVPDSSCIFEQWSNESCVNSDKILLHVHSPIGF